MKLPYTRFSAVVVASLSMFFSPSASAEAQDQSDLDQAPPSISVHSFKVIPIDFQHVDMQMEFDIPNKKATGKSRIEFYADEDGNPFFSFVPKATSVKLNGENLGPEGIELVDSPAKTKLNVLTRAVARRTSNVLELTWEIPAKAVTFTAGGARMVWSMSDLTEAHEFLDQYAPSNMEFDQFSMDFTFSLIGATRGHEVFANGKVEDQPGDTWKISFPNYFTTSSFYFHVTDKSLKVEKDTFQGINGPIPVTVYSEWGSVSSAMTKTKETMKELETTYGPYAHDSMIVFLTSGLGGGMEHCGATITSSWALTHEITHSWFARGVMPSGGNSGWIDEAIASWRDNGYPKKAQSTTASPVNLAAFSPYKHSTTEAAYSKGATLLAGIDHLFTNGLKVVLREIFAEKRQRTITTPEFEKMLNRFGGKDVGDYFKRFVYNEGHAIPEPQDHTHLTNLLPQLEYHPVHHPRPYTQAEIEQIR